MQQIFTILSKINQFRLICLIGISFCSSPLIAYENFYGDHTWHPVLTVGGGFLFSSNLGENQNYPIQLPITDSFYKYSPNGGTRSSGLFDAFFGFEWYLGESGALEIGLGYNQAVPFNVKGTLTQGVDANSQGQYTYQYDITLCQLMVEGKILTTFSNTYHPYFFAGAGAAYNRASQFTTNVPSFLTFTRMYANNSNTSFTYSLGVGLDYDVDQVFRIGVGYRFSDYGAVKLGSATIDTTNVNGTLSQSHLYTNEVLAQITYNIVM